VPLLQTGAKAIRILLVEDDDLYAGLVDAELRAASMPAVLCRTRYLHDASRLVRHEPFDVVLLDLGLPDSSGLATLERLQDAAAETPIVVLTAQDSDALAISALHSGAEDYLMKSRTDADLLSRSLRYACERAASRRALRRSEEQLRQAQKMEAVGRLAGGIAHDFNNVLTAIFGYVDLLLNQFEPGDARRDDLEEIRSSAERAAALTRQLVAFSRKQMLEPRLLDLNEVVAGLQKLLARLMMEHIQLIVKPAPDLWKVKADAGQLEQVVINLCANARDAMPDGGTLRMAVEGVTAPGPDAALQRWVSLVVSDTGCGMDGETVAKIFEPFFTTKERGKGTGLGLSTVYGIVKQNRGQITVDSAPGRGTTFRILLPAQP
jgi:signal transduction histidine kinase